MYAHASKGPNFYKESFFDVESCKANQDFFYLDDGHMPFQIKPQNPKFSSSQS